MHLAVCTHASTCACTRACRHARTHASNQCMHLHLLMMREVPNETYDITQCLGRAVLAGCTPAAL